MLRIGVLGAGHLGKIHLRLLQESKAYELVGFYDACANQTQLVREEFGYRAFSSFEELLTAVEVVDIVTPTLAHYAVAKKAMQLGKHVFIEKPITSTVAEAKDLMQLSKAYGVKGQVGHVERFNPAFTSVAGIIKDPMFIESHRLAEFNPRGTDVPVVLDLMIHDIDAILSVVTSPIQAIHASGVAVVSETPDIANARIAFENGCVANLTASRISLKNMRKSRFFQKDAYVAVDFYNKKCEVVKMKDAPLHPDDFAMILQNAEGKKKQIYFDNPKVSANNAILDELETFASAIRNDTEPIVTIDQAKAALEVAHQIIDCF